MNRIKKIKAVLSILLTAVLLSLSACTIDTPEIRSYVDNVKADMLEAVNNTRKLKEQQKKLKGQGFKAHWDYFWEYYKIHTIVAIVVLIFIAVTIRDISNNKPYAMYAMFINNRGMETQNILQDGFTEYAHIDTDNYAVIVLKF